MKHATKQFARATADVESRVRKLLADIRPAIQQNYQLPEVLVNLAVYQGVAKMTVECSKPIGDTELNAWAAELTALTGEADTLVTEAMQFATNEAT